MDASEGLDNCGRRKLKYFEGKYSREACRKECFTDYLLKACSCREAYMPGNAKLCESEVVMDCINPSTDQYLLSRPDCESSCPDTCSYNTFTLKTASSLRLTDEYLSTLANATDDSLEYWRRNFVAIEVYHSSMSYPYIRKRYSYLVLDLFCDIGGALGLVLGASIATVVELCDFTVKRVSAFCSYKRRVRDGVTMPKLTQSRF